MSKKKGHRKTYWIEDGKIYVGSILGLSLQPIRKRKRKKVCRWCGGTGEIEYVPLGMPSQHYCYKPCPVCHPSPEPQENK